MSDQANLEVMQIREAVIAEGGDPDDLLDIELYLIRRDPSFFQPIKRLLFGLKAVIAREFIGSLLYQGSIVVLIVVLIALAQTVRGALGVTIFLAALAVGISGIALIFAAWERANGQGRLAILTLWGTCGLVAAVWGWSAFQQQRMNALSTPWDIRVNGGYGAGSLFEDRKFFVNVWHQEPGTIKTGRITVEAQSESLLPSAQGIQEYSFAEWHPNAENGRRFEFPITDVGDSLEVTIKVRVEGVGDLRKPFEAQFTWRGQGWLIPSKRNPARILSTE